MDLTLEQRAIPQLPVCEGIFSEQLHYYARASSLFTEFRCVLLPPVLESEKIIEGGTYNL